MVGSCNDSKVLLAPINNTAGHKDRRHRRVVAETGAGSAALAPAGPLLRVYVINSHALCGSNLRSTNRALASLETSAIAAGENINPSDELCWDDVASETIPPR